MSDYGRGYHGAHHGAAGQGKQTLGTWAGQNAAATHRPKPEAFSNPTFGDVQLPPAITPSGSAGPAKPTGPYSHYDSDTTWGRGNRLFTLLGTVGGLGYGVWVAMLSGGGSALGTGPLGIAKWTLAGAVGGALFQMALVAALSLGLLFAILWGLGLLLKLLAG